MITEMLISFAPATLADALLLFRWRQVPHVARWWNIAPYEAATLGHVEEELRTDFALAKHESLLILLDGTPVGYAQLYNAGRASGDWWPDESEAAGGLDLFIGEESLVGQGLGPRIVRALCERMFADEGITSIIVDPQPDNVRSIRCFGKVGFVPEREIETPDGRALLMRLGREGFNRLERF